MKNNISRSISLLLVSEGSELNINPPGTPHGQGEPGGASHWGVSVSALTDLRRSRDLVPATVQDVIDLTEEQASDFYQSVTARACRFDDLPSGVDYRALDVFANLGPTGGAHLVQVTLGMWPLADTITDAVLGEIGKLDPEVMIIALGAAWLAKKSGQPGWVKSGHGWTNRANRVNSDAIRMFKGE